MAFFKFRTAGESPGAKRQPESIEAIRRRARHRLIGATVLVLIGVVGFPLLFDTQPRPIPVDIPITIPDRSKAKALPLPVPPAPQPMATGKVTAPAPAPATSAVVAAPASAAVAKVEAPLPKPEAAPAKTEPAAKAPASAPARSEPKPEAKGAAKPPAANDAGKAQALLDGKAPAPAAAEGRFVVQVGAFADNTKARQARLRVERAGLKTYTQVAETKDGRRIRVRVGPFPTRADADKAARKIKGLDLPAAILTL